MTEPLATYREATWSYRRSFELYPDRMVVHMRSVQLNADSEFRLADLRLPPNHLRVLQSGALWGGFICLVAAGIAGYVAHLLGRIGHIEGPTPFAVGLLIIGLFICCFYGGRIEYTQFVSHTGIAMLDVARSGPDRRRYDEFVALLKETIAACQLKRDRAP